MGPITSASKETIDGIKFTLIYNAVSTFVESGASRRVKSKSLRQVASRNSCRYCLRFASEQHEFYYFSPKSGVSIARQIEEYIESSDDPHWQDDIKKTIIIALDRRIYIADVENAGVTAERVLILAAAEKAISELHQSGEAVFYCANGAASNEIDLAGMEKLEGFDLLIKKSRATKPFYFVSLSQLMTRMGLYHQAQMLVAGPLLISLVVVGYGYLEYQSEIKHGLLRAQEIALRESNRIASESRERTSKSEANHSASVNLIDFLGIYQKALGMVADGAERVAWDRESILIEGKSVRFPAKAAGMGESGHGAFRLTDGGGWEIAWGQQAHTDNKATTASATAMRQSLFSLAGLTGGAMNIAKVTNKNNHETVVFSLAFSVGVPAVITLLSNEMRNKPYTMDAAVCQFSKMRPVGCQLTMTAKYATAKEN